MYYFPRGLQFLILNSIYVYSILYFYGFKMFCKYSAISNKLKFAKLMFLLNPIRFFIKKLLYFLVHRNQFTSYVA